SPLRRRPVRLPAGHDHLRQGHDLRLLADRGAAGLRPDRRAVPARRDLVPARVHLRRPPGVGGGRTGQPRHPGAGRPARARTGERGRVPSHPVEAARPADRRRGPRRRLLLRDRAGQGQGDEGDLRRRGVRAAAARLPVPGAVRGRPLLPCRRPRRPGRPARPAADLRAVPLRRDRADPPVGADGGLVPDLIGGYRGCPSSAEEGHPRFNFPATPAARPGRPTDRPRDRRSPTSKRRRPGRLGGPPIVECDRHNGWAMTTLPLVFDAPARPRTPPRHLADLPPAERRAAVAELGLPAYRAGQLSQHYFARLTDDPAAMTDLPVAVRGPLAEALLPTLWTPVRQVSCDDGATRKTLWRAFDGALVESVLMRYPDRVTMCVSSQAGCGMACPFCATGQAGLTRNLSTAEIVAQVVAGARMLAAGEVPGGPGRVSNVVFMGMGEPLANYASVLAAVRRVTEPVPEGMGISQRSVTVSTVGLVPAITRLAAEGLSVTLAVSLHAPDDELRDTLVPVNRRWKVAEVLDAAWGYAATTGRRVSIEYALIRDINDHAWRADLLGSLLAGRLAHVNLIPLNPTPGSKWTASRPAAQREFVRRLEAHGVPVTVRDTRGREIDGACGQLAASAVARP